MRIKQPVLAIDFDETIHDRKNPIGGKKMGAPLPGAIDALEELASDGYRIIIHSCVAHTPAGWQAIEEWLEFYDVPYHDITAVKPVADLYIDDKGLHYTDWTQTINEIYRRTGRERD